MKKTFRKRKLNKKTALRVLALVLIICTVSLLYGNFSLDVERINIQTEKLPESYQNYLIAHISDYHNRKSKIIDKQILDSLTAEQPDIIVITGDVVDATYTDIDVAVDFVAKLCEIAPVYYVTGNHESNVLNGGKDFDGLINGLTEVGVCVLRNSKVKIENSAGDTFTLCGIDDPYFYGDYAQIFQGTDTMCDGLSIEENEFNVLLAHHPEALPVYYKHGIDLVFSGHAHGGQVTLFGKAIMAPDQKTFPPYTGGLYEMGGTQLVLSRGIGYSVLPLRVFCRPHLVYAEFKVSK